jgi:AraC family transcriptional regulator
MKIQGVKHKGEIKNNQQISGFHLTEILYPPGFSISEHFHQNACLSLVLQGVYREKFREKTIECKPFRLIFRPAGEIHSDHFGNNMTSCLLIEFETTWLKNLCQNSIKWDEPASFKSNSLVWLAMKLRQEFQQSDDFTPLTIEGLMLELIAGIGRNSENVSAPKPPLWLKQAREILHESFSENISLSEIAGCAGVHPVYFAEKFKQHYQCTVGEYVRRLRIEFASRQISETDAPLVDIGLASGFSHQAHFSRTFKRLTGLTPAQFRSNSRR